MKQLALRTWGGKRPGAGRKRKAERERVPHRKRAVLKKRFPVLVTIRMHDGALNLRNGHCFTVLKRAFAGARDRFGMRLCEFSVQGNHLHLIVEAGDERALARGMQGLGVRMAIALNRALKREGAVYGDRYHARILKTLREVKNAINYVLKNAHKHGFLHRGLDPYSSSIERTDVAPAENWLLYTEVDAAASAGLILNL